MKTINIAKDYTPYPGGRYPEDGSGNGEDFREKHLIPVFNNQESAIIELDGVVGYPSSFLEEAFGGLVRKHNIQPERILGTFNSTRIIL